MPDEPEPHGRIASTIHEGHAAIKTVMGFTLDQGIRFVAIILMGIISAVGLFLLWDSRNDRSNERAQQERYFEGQRELDRQGQDKRDKQLLDWASAEQEKSRQHCERAEEKQRKFF